MLLNRRCADPSYGWILRRIQHVHGLKNVIYIFPELDKFEPDPTQITCPIYISWAEKDELAIESKELYERVASENKKFVHYKEADGSAEHCEIANRSSFNADALDWLDELWA